MSSATAQRPRTRLDADERRRQILAVARRLFGDRPYATVSLADIAEAAGVARGLVNHYFGSKRALYLEVLRGMLALPERVMTAVAPGTMETRANAIVDRFLSVVERHRGIWLVTVDALATRGDDEIERVMREAEDVTVSRVIMALGLDEHLADEHLRAALRAFGGMIRAGSAEWLTHGTLTRQQTLDLLSSTLVAVVLRVIHGRHSPEPAPGAAEPATPVVQPGG